MWTPIKKKSINTNTDSKNKNDVNSKNNSDADSKNNNDADSNSDNESDSKNNNDADSKNNNDADSNSGTNPFNTPNDVVVVKGRNLRLAGQLSHAHQSNMLTDFARLMEQLASQRLGRTFWMSVLWTGTQGCYRFSFCFTNIGSVLHYVHVHMEFRVERPASVKVTKKSTRYFNMIWIMFWTYVINLKWNTCMHVACIMFWVIEKLKNFVFVTVNV